MNLDPRKVIPEFQAKVMAAETCEEMLEASMAFIQFHGGFSGAPEVREKFLVGRLSEVDKVA